MLGMALVMTGVVVREPRIWVCPPREAALICGWRKSLAQRPKGEKETQTEGKGLGTRGWAFVNMARAAGPCPQLNSIQH